MKTEETAPRKSGLPNRGRQDVRMVILCLQGMDDVDSSNIEANTMLPRLRYHVQFMYKGYPIRPCWCLFIDIAMRITADWSTKMTGVTEGRSILTWYKILLFSVFSVFSALSFSLSSLSSTLPSAIAPTLTHSFSLTLPHTQTTLNSHPLLLFRSYTHTRQV